MAEQVLPSGIERVHEVQGGKAKSLVASDSEENVGAARRRSSELRRRWQTTARPAAAASERKGEREGRASQMREEGEAGVAGGSWWPTRVHPWRRMAATWW